MPEYGYADFAHQFDKCWICGKRHNAFVWEGGLQTHHITRGVHRAKGVLLPETWIRTCVRCHEDDLAAMPIAKQLAYKRIHDKEHYDLDLINHLRRRAPTAITGDEVMEEVRKIQEVSDG